MGGSPLSNPDEINVGLSYISKIVFSVCTKVSKKQTKEIAACLDDIHYIIHLYIFVCTWFSYHLRNVTSGLRRPVTTAFAIGHVAAFAVNAALVASQWQYHAWTFTLTHPLTPRTEPLSLRYARPGIESNLPGLVTRAQPTVSLSRSLHHYLEKLYVRDVALVGNEPKLQTLMVAFFLPSLWSLKLLNKLSSGLFDQLTANFVQCLQSRHKKIT